MSDTLAKWEARAARAKQNRVDMPWVTSVVDDHRAHLGEGVRCVYAFENGVEYGKPSIRGVMATPAEAPGDDVHARAATRLVRYKRALDKAGDEVATVAIVGSLFGEAAP